MSYCTTNIRRTYLQLVFSDFALESPLHSLNRIECAFSKHKLYGSNSPYDHLQTRCLTLSSSYVQATLYFQTNNEEMGSLLAKILCAQI